MGTGVIHSRSSKQKINTKSSCESALVGASDYLPYAIWFTYFLKSQGYEIKKKIFFQDNQSTIKLLKNGKKSAGKQSKHISARYFWMVDRIKRENLIVEYCPSRMMLGDFFTKSLQGSLFRKMRDVVLGAAPVTTLKTEEELGRTSRSDREVMSIDDRNEVSDNIVEATTERNAPHTMVSDDEAETSTPEINTVEVDQELEGRTPKSMLKKKILVPILKFSSSTRNKERVGKRRIRFHDNGLVDNKNNKQEYVRNLRTSKFLNKAYTHYPTYKNIALGKCI